MSFLTLSSELAGTVPGLPYPLASTYIKRAWRSIRDERLWSFLIGEGMLVCPTQVTTGTVSVTQYSATVTCDAGATTALNALGPVPGITNLQFRSSNSSVYSILAASGSPLILTLDRVYQEPSGSSQPYQVYRAYAQAPVSDFLSWDSLDDFATGYAITGDRTTRSRTEFDRRDPQRQAQSQAYYLGWFKDTATGATLWELWPHPTQGQTFVVTFRRQGPEFIAPSDTQSQYIPDELIMTRALAYHAYPWAQANQGRVADLKGANLAQLKRDARDEYGRELIKAKKQDDEVMLQRVYNRGRQKNAGGGMLGPADAKFWQSHPITW